MFLEIDIIMDADTEKQLFAQSWTLEDLRRAVHAATEAFERDVKRSAPKATGEYVASIDSEVHEYGDPFRFVCRISSSHHAADVIEFGAGPHVVPIRAILRWMQAVNMHIKYGLTVEEVAHRIQQKIAERGLAPHFVFTDASERAERHFAGYVDPVLSSIDGAATYRVRLQPTGSYELPWE